MGEFPFLSEALKQTLMNSIVLAKLLRVSRMPKGDIQVD